MHVKQDMKKKEKKKNLNKQTRDNDLNVYRP